MHLIRLAALASLIALAGCAYLPMGEAQRVPSEAPKPSQQHSAVKQEQPRITYKTQPGQVDPKIQPYSVMGKTYWPVQSAMGFREEGYASWYGMDFHGKKTATGETYDMFSVSAAHKTLPLGSKVRVTNLENGRELELMVNDRGPFVDGRIIDLSYASARLLGMADNGLARVRVVGVAENPVLAQRAFNGMAVASADAPPRKKGQIVERTLSEEPPRPQQAKAQLAEAKAQPAKVVRRDEPAKAGPQVVQASAQGSGRYAVQVGAFSQDDNARKVKEKLVQIGFRHATVTRAVRGGRELSVVQAGFFSEREAAEEALRSLKEEFPASFINTGA